MTVFPVLLTTEEGTSVEAIYTNREAAFEHISRRFASELDGFQSGGYRKKDLGVYREPNERACEAAVGSTLENFWWWKFGECLVCSVCNVIDIR